MALHTAQQLNCAWPLVRGGKGWARAGMADRYRAALRNLLRTPVGYYPWAPTYGTSLYKLRTQGVGKEDAGLAKAELSRAISTWIPDIDLRGVELEMDGANKRLSIIVTWSLPAAPQSPVPTVLGPFKTTVRI